MTPTRRLIPFLLALAAFGLASPAPSLASSCGTAVYDQAVRGPIAAYHTHGCYLAALHLLSADDVTYTNAEQNIRAAMQRDARVDSTLAGAPAENASGAPATQIRSSAGLTAPSASTPAGSIEVAQGGRTQPAGPGLTQPVGSGGTADGHAQGLATRTLLDMRGSSSVPLPVIVLGVLSLLLMAGGLGGLLLRRRMARTPGA